MSALKTYRASLGVAGSLALLSGIAHFAWYGFMRGYVELAGMSDVQWQFLALLNHSVGLLLAFMGAAALAVAASRDAGLTLLRTFGVLLFATWCTRFAFELALPVRVPFFTMQAPSAFFKALMAVLLAILAAPEILLRAGTVER